VLDEAEEIKEEAVMDEPPPSRSPPPPPREVNFSARGVTDVDRW
jgi:hypothetical protein